MITSEKIAIDLLFAIPVSGCASKQVGETTPIEAIHLVEKIVNEEAPRIRLIPTSALSH